MQRLLRTAAPALLALTIFAACGDDDGGDDEAGTTTTGADETTTSTTEEETTTTTEPEPIVVLVTNDDGIGAPGIDAIVQSLQEREGLEIHVVAPAENQSGSSDSTTPGGPPAAVPATTASGFEGYSVAGEPADSVLAALDDLGLEPDIVVSGTNSGQNMGPISGISGTVGAAKTAARRGIPAIAVSTGFGSPDPEEFDFETTVEFFNQVWDDELEGLLAGGPVVRNLNVPTCPEGTEVRGFVEEPTGTEDRGQGVASNSASTAGPDFIDDLDAFVNGYAVIATVPF